MESKESKEEITKQQQKPAKDKKRLSLGLKAPVKINLYTQSLMKATHLHPAGAGLKYVTVCPCKLAAMDRCAATRDEAGQCTNSSERNAPPCQTRTRACTHMLAHGHSKP